MHESDKSVANAGALGEPKRVRKVYIIYTRSFCKFSGILCLSVSFGDTVSCLSVYNFRGYPVFL